MNGSAGDGAEGMSVAARFLLHPDECTLLRCGRAGDSRLFAGGSVGGSGPGWEKQRGL